MLYILSSSRFPTKDWMPLGKFDMSADRVIQSFSTQVNEEFVKFVRVEILEHHGDEHYCPITTFRLAKIISKTVIFVLTVTKIIIKICHIYAYCY